MLKCMKKERKKEVTSRSRPPQWPWPLTVLVDDRRDISGREFHPHPSLSFSSPLAPSSLRNSRFPFLYDDACVFDEEPRDSVGLISLSPLKKSFYQKNFYPKKIIIRFQSRFPFFSCFFFFTLQQSMRRKNNSFYTFRTTDFIFPRQRPQEKKKLSFPPTLKKKFISWFQEKKGNSSSGNTGIVTCKTVI